MDITLNAIAFRNGTPFNAKLNLTQRDDGTWHATNVGEIMRTHLLLFRLVIHPFVENAARQDEIVDLSPQEKLRPEGIGFRVILVI